MTWDEPTNEKCGICGSMMLKKKYGKSFKMYCKNPECENTLKARPKTAKKTMADVSAVVPGIK